jgi:hypothetical protein
VNCERRFSNPSRPPQLAASFIGSMPEQIPDQRHALTNVCIALRPVPLSAAERTSQQTTVRIGLFYARPRWDTFIFIFVRAIN